MGSTLWSKRYSSQKGRNRKKRPKTFKSRAAAEAYAGNKGLKNYELVDLKPYSKEHKIKVIEN